MNSRCVRQCMSNKWLTILGVTLFMAVIGALVGASNCLAPGVTAPAVALCAGLGAIIGLSIGLAVSIAGTFLQCNVQCSLSNQSGLNNS